MSWDATSSDHLGHGATCCFVEKYDDLPLGTVDAAVVAIAERLGADRIATLNRRHFSVVRPASGTFVLAPEELCPDPIRRKR